MRKSPCMNCNKREMYCHGGCGKYKKNLKVIIRKNKDRLAAEYDFNNYLNNAIARERG